MTLERAWEHYRTANRDYRKLLICTRIEQRDDPDSLLARARNRERDALAEYLRALQDLRQHAREGKLKKAN